MKHLFLFFILFLTGCSTLPQVHTEYEQKIEKNKKQMYDDGRDLIAKAKQILQNAKTKDPNIEKAIDIIEKGQILIESKVDDGSELKTLEGKELDKMVDKIIDKDKELIKENENLEEKNKDLLDQTLAEKIGDDAVNRYKRYKNIKFYTICITILGGLGALFYFFPTQSLGILWRVVGFIKNLFIK